MGRYIVRGIRRGIAVQWIADRATDEADAVRQFEELYKRCSPGAVASPLDPIPGTPPEPEPDSSPPEAAAAVSSRAEPAAPAGSPPKKQATPAAEGTKSGPTTQPSDAATPEPDTEVGVLESYGVKPNDLAELYAAGLRTVAAVEAFDAEHGGLTNVHGVGPMGEQQIREGIAAWRQTSKI